MAKLRWTIGDTSKIGIEILQESIIRAKKNLFGFDYYVCFNGTKHFKQIKELCGRYDVELIVQDWNRDFPLPKEIIPAIAENQSQFDLNNKSGVPTGRQGSFWKLCPPRMFPNDYEIVCDNDVIIQSCPKEVDEFLLGAKPLIVQEDAMALGKYFKYVNKAYNSGFYGFPPGFDFEKLLVDNWLQTNAMAPLLSRDEQGLIISTLFRHDCIEVPKSKVSHIFNNGKAKLVGYSEVNEQGNLSRFVSSIEFEEPNINNEIIHFLGSNRNRFHHYWHQYKKLNQRLL